jgi:ATP-binding cassette subfamily C protein
VESARQAVDDAVLSLLVAATFGLVGLAYLFAAGATIGLISTVAVAVVLTVSVTVQWRGRSFMPPLLERRSQTDAYLLSLLENATSWRTSGGEGRALGLWAQVQRGSTRAMADRLRSISLSGPVEAAAPTAVLVAFVVAVVILPVPALEPGNPAATGLFLALYAAVAQVTIAVLALGANLITLSEYGPQLARLEPILEAPTEQDRSPGHPGELRGAVSLRGVEFGYRGDRPPLFSGLSLDVAPGEFVAIVGPSGSGKSTLLRLMLGFEDPWEGTVSYDGIDLTQLDAPAVRRQLGTVLQSSRLLGSTVRECIGGPLMLSQERLDDVVERAGLAEDIAGLPDGLDSLVGEGGSALSGGQRQRLLIASALARDPAIFLLDEATSALDNQTQAVVMRTILTSTATRIVVAHRLSTVRRADRVVVVAHGGIAEQGAPDDLIAAGGLFARLAARQEA